MDRDGAEPTIAVLAPSRESAQGLAEAVLRAGAKAWVVCPGPAMEHGDVLSRAGGLVVAGDETMDAGLSGQGASHGREPAQADRSGPAASYAPALIRAAMEAGRPVLGIGDGMRAMNVASGGGPGRAVEGHAPGEGAAAPSSFHRIFISPGSKLAAIVGSGGFVRVNSRHDLGIRDAHRSPLLMASAYSLEDGVVEALESPDQAFAVAVQFRPEIRKELPPHFERLFAALVERAREFTDESQLTKNTSL